LVAFQHTNHHTVSGSDGFHELEDNYARAVTPRTGAHAFYNRRKARMTRHLTCIDNQFRTLIKALFIRHELNENC